MAEPALRGGSVELRDGRTLAYNEFGDPAGRPLLHFHGVPSSRVEGSIMAAALAGTGARVIYPDRPGIGLSDHQQDRALLDWAADVEQLATALGIARFGVLGYSGGGPTPSRAGSRFRRASAPSAWLRGLRRPSFRTTWMASARQTVS